MHDVHTFVLPVEMEEVPNVRTSDEWLQRLGNANITTMMLDPQFCDFRCSRDAAVYIQPETSPDSRHLSAFSIDNDTLYLK